MRTVLLVATCLAVAAACGSEDTPESPTAESEVPVTEPAATGSPPSDPSPPPSDSTPPPSESPSESIETTSSEAPTTSPNSAATSSERLANLAVTDLADRLGFARDEISVLSVDEVTWRSGAIGCPQKDFQYTQVLTPGVRLVLEHDGRTYVYHAGGGRDPFYCVDPEPPADQ